MSSSATRRQNNNDDDDNDDNEATVTVSSFTLKRCAGRRVRLYQSTDAKIFQLGRFALQIDCSGRLVELDNQGHEYFRVEKECCWNRAHEWCREKTQSCWCRNVAFDDGLLADCTENERTPLDLVGEYLFHDVDTKRLLAIITIDRKTGHQIVFYDETDAERDDAEFAQSLLE
jgi:hypothetical protein